MRVAFRDLAEGKAVNPPRLRYSTDTADPKRRYFANIHAGAVQTYQTACVRAGSHFMLMDEQQRPAPHARQSRSGQLVGHHPLRPDQRRAARVHARDASVGLPRRRHHRARRRRMRAPRRRGAGPVRHRQPGFSELPRHLRGAADQAREGVQPERGSPRSVQGADGGRKGRGDRGRRPARRRARRAYRLLRHQCDHAGAQGRMAGARARWS